MPAAIPIISAIIGAVGVGTKLVGMFDRSSAPTVPPTQPPAPAGPSSQQIQSVVSSQLPTIQSLTGGSLSPDYLLTYAPIFGGVGGAPGLDPIVRRLLAQFLGTGGGGSAGGGLPGAGLDTGSTCQPSGLPSSSAAASVSPGISDF